ncbi:hypothetical protein RhiirC2_705199 [Rhizophagus irregularis]|uniref:Uncharacterized protein n=1 Tax=Rhizophagus irregularis TaxID=588596 RepID=A0A2N1NZH8_9GLOM|nr:hypothetical protein RhiirC2_705199 [Rhizophagus irregularis]
MVLWFLRFLLKEHRSEWAGIYERSEQYITKELGGDLEVEEIAIAGGRKAVRERFEIKDDLIVHSKTIVIARRTVSVRLFGSAEEAKKSLETHFSSYSKISKLDVNLHSSAIMIWFIRYVLADFRIDKYQITSKWITEQEIEDENGAIVTQVIIGLLKIKVKNARNLPKSSLLFTSSKPDPYLINLLGTYVFETAKIVKKSEDGFYVTSEPIRELFSLVIGRKPSGGELDLEVQFVSTQYNWKETWKNISADSEEWLGSEIDNIELEDKLYEICENFIIKRFNIKDLDEEQKNILISVKKRVIITRKLVTIRVIRRIHVYQTQDRAIPLDKTAELLGFENTEDLKKELQTYFKSESVKKVERLWVLHSKYITQTYNFSLNDLKEAYDNNGNE